MNEYKILEGKFYYHLGRPAGKIKTIDKLTNGYYKVSIIEDPFCGKRNFNKVIIWTEEILNRELNKFKTRYERYNILQERKITRVTHFTKIENLENILEYGLLSLEKLKQNGISYQNSDNLRLDNKMNYLCTSFMHPNHSMFYSKRMEDINQEWVVLGIDSIITVHELNSLFYPTNAAASSCQFYEDRNTNEALLELFNGERELELPDYYPTNVQAEVLIKDEIEKKYLREIHTLGTNEKVKSLALNSNLNYERNSNMFNMRGFRRFY